MAALLPRWRFGLVGFALLLLFNAASAQKPVDLLPRRADNVCDRAPGSTVLIPFERLPPPKDAASAQPAAEESEPRPMGQQPLQNLLYFPELVSAPCPEGAAEAKAPKEQVQLSVTLVEVDRRVAEALKLKAGEVRMPLVVDNGGTRRKIARLRGAGRARVVAEPTLLTADGQKASFFAGGQLPVPVPRPDGEPAVTFVPFGVHLQFLPTLVNKDLVRLQLRAEISSRVQGLGVNTRSLSATVELRPGQTVTLGGFDVDGDADRPLVLAVTPQVVRAGQTEAAPNVVRKIYNVADVTAPPLGCKTPREDRPDRLVNALISFVAPEQWQSNGGKATVDYFPQTMTLVVNAPEDLHAKVGEFLETLRRLGPTPR